MQGLRGLDFWVWASVLGSGFRVQGPESLEFRASGRKLTFQDVCMALFCHNCVYRISATDILSQDSPSSHPKPVEARSPKGLKHNEAKT